MSFDPEIPVEIHYNDISSGTSISVIFNMYLRTLNDLYQKKAIEIDESEGVDRYIVRRTRELLLKSVDFVQGNRSEDNAIDEGYLFEHVVANCAYMLSHMTEDPYERLKNG